MIPNEKFKMIYGRERSDGIGVKIYVACNHELNRDVVDDTLWRAGEAIFNEVYKDSMLSNKEDVAASQESKAKILALFGDRAIYVEEIPNGYGGNDPYYVNKPWFIVTTAIGHIKIGWRKRVINIDWSKTNVKTRAEDLFPNEDVTKEDHYIHAWGYEKAKEYIDKLIDNAK